MEERKIRWGILSTGRIAGAFAKGLRFMQQAELLAVGSRTAEAATRFASAYEIPRYYASYRDLAEDPDLDVIYIGTPHNLHCENMLLCLENGKAVLCEKPFTISAREARAVINLARQKRLFVMEAMWPRFLPMFTELRRIIEEGVIGELRLIITDFGYRMHFDPAHRSFNPALGGGSLLDVGVYPISFTSMIFGGPPQEVVTLAQLGKTGVDEQAGIVMKYTGGRLALIACASRTATAQETFIYGTEGYLRLHPPSWRSTRATLHKPDLANELDFPFVGNGYNYEALEVMRCLRNGELESPRMRLAETLSVMETMDRIRATWPLRYPMEQNPLEML